MGSFGSDEGDVAYLVVCAAPPAREAATLVGLLGRAGWRTCIVVTPSAREWVDGDRLAEVSGHPVRSRFRGPDDPPFVPLGDALLVAPSTFNTVNRWAAGLNDTLALGLANEALGAGIPVVTVPWVGAELAAHPAYARNLDVLRLAGVEVVPTPTGSFLDAAADAVDRLGGPGRGGAGPPSADPGGWLA